MPSKYLLFFIAATAFGQLYVSPAGDDGNPGTQARPVRSLERARDLARERSGKRTVTVAKGVYRLARTLVSDHRDSGITFSGSGDAIVSGGIRIANWRLVDRERNLWSAETPAALSNARQIYVDGVRATRTRGRLPVRVTPTAAGYTASSGAISKWRNPGDLEFVYTGGNSVWSEHSVGLGS